MRSALSSHPEAPAASVVSGSVLSNGGKFSNGSKNDAAVGSSALASSVGSDLLDGSAANAKPAGPSLPSNLNVIVISIDSLRADMPWAGYPRDIAPNLTALEKKSVSFTHAYSVSSYTSMSLGGLLAGRYPSELKRDGFFFGTYAKENLFFPELLQAAHIRTVSAHAHGYFKDAGFQQGFDAWELVPNLKWNNLTDENVTGEAHEKIAERLLAGAGSGAVVGSGSASGSDGGVTSELADGGAGEGGRFFAWFHFLDPHDIYMSHEADGIPSFGNKPRDKYDAEVVYTDQKLGKLLAFIEKSPWASHTAIIVTADHGEAFGEHKQFLHGFEVWENLVRVPFFFYVPGVPAKRLETEVSAIDLAPTILDFMGVAKDPAMEGRTLVPSIVAGQEPEAREVIVDLPATSDNDRRRALIFNHKKIISTGSIPSPDGVLRMFDLASDPGEEHPISPSSPSSLASSSSPGSAGSGSASDDFNALAARYRSASAQIKEVMPYACQKSCLNRAYLNQGTK